VVATFSKTFKQVVFMLQYDIVASIVTYNNNVDILNQCIDSFLKTDLTVHLYISDNSPVDSIKHKIPNDKRITYIYNKKNLGFGKAHNKCINRAVNKSKYYIILNPDIYFDGQILKQLYDYLESNAEVGLLSPKIVYPDERLQLSCRLIPSPLDMFARRLPQGEKLFKRRIRKHQFEDNSFDKNMEVPFLLGCFLMIRSSVLEKVGGFDERFFMYMEDLDLCRRVGNVSKIMFYAKAKIYHIYERASAKQTKLFFIHLKSMSKYFNKWGWFLDKDRSRINAIYRIPE
jgi:GT2 family glycosyltransferase